MNQDIDRWVGKILEGDPRAISRAITSVENRDDTARELVKRLFPHTGRATIIGITGAGGSGKSSLVDAMIASLRKRGKTVGALAVDPTSPFTGGAILGDRIRMQAHSGDSSVYIRSMATRGSLGGLASATMDAALVLDAAGKDYILVETVGTGQDEVEIAKLADVTLLLLVPGLGDDVQAFKAGVMEIAEIFVINKSDLAGADRVEQEVHALLSLASATDGWQPPIVRTIATRQQGVDELLDAVTAYMEFSEQNDARKQRRLDHWRERLLTILRDRLLQQVMRNVLEDGVFNQYAAAVASRSEDPYSVVDQVLEQSGLESKTEGASAAFMLDHIGVAVDSLSQAVNFYQQILGLEVSGYHSVSQEKTNVAMLRLGGSRIELLEPTEPDSPIGRFVAKRGGGPHHICLRVPDLSAVIAKLQQSGVKLINSEPAIGAGGHRYVFVHPGSTGGVLLELVQES